MSIASEFRVSVRAVLFLFPFLFSIALAGNGKIAGRVTDSETREPLAGVNIVITHMILSGDREVPLDKMLGAASDADGYFVIVNVTPGTYIVKASMVGFKTVIQRMIRVESDRTINVNFALDPATVELEPVVITARREAVEADVARTQEVITSTRLEQMPVVRVDEFVNKIKGVQLVSGADGYGLSVRGGGIRETDVRLDGISLQDPRSENSYLALNSTTVQEMQVLTGGFEAKYGGIRSGLLNVVTKEGHRDRYTVAIKVDAAPAGQQRIFGTNPFSDSSWVYKVYSGQYAFSGVPRGDSSVPTEFRNFRGWRVNNPGQDVRMNYLDSLQRLDIWRKQHPQYQIGSKPDYFVEGSITGPFPGSGIPILEEYANRTTFLLGFKYEKSYFVFPIGPRDSYTDWNGQLKLTTQLANDLKLSLNGMYANIETINSGGTTSYGGALVDQSSSYSFMNTTDASYRQQMRLIGSDNFFFIYNKSRFQFLDQRYIVGGAKLTHTFSNTAFQTFDFQFGLTDQQLEPFGTMAGDADSLTYTRPNGNWYSFWDASTYGSPNSSTNPGNDVLNMFRMYGGLQRIDSSKSWVLQFKWDMTAQLGRHHQVDAGFSARYQNLFVYTGTWYQAQLSYTPDLWQYYTATPLEMGLYLQDKLEFEGMVLNAGMRVDYLNPMKKSYSTGIPLDEDYKNFFQLVYQNLPGASGGYERWSLFRDLLANPPGWPQEKNVQQIYFSPRAGVSFPVTEKSKLYFNYGHFYQRPAISFLYNQVIGDGWVIIPAPNLRMGRTVSYEFGYEQFFFDEVLLNVTAYYKDIRNEPLSRQFISYYGDINVTTYFPDAYGDVRGVELRVERPMGRFVTFQAMYDFMVRSSGRSGLQKIYENRLQAFDEQRSANLTTVDPLPRANVTLSLHTPKAFGPELFGVPLFESIYTTFFFEWRDNGRFLYNPTELDVKKHIWIDVVDFWNVDFRGSKAFDLSFGSLEFVVTVKNLLNNKFLIPENMLRSQYDEYKNSLRLPNQGGSDKWGQYKSDDGHIKTGWYDAVIFTAPRRILLGLRLNF